jgi:hypothetical protein
MYRWLHFKFHYNYMGKRKVYPIMSPGMAPLRWWMPPMKMDLRCPSTPAAPWQALGVLLPRGDLPCAWKRSLSSILPNGLSRSRFYLPWQLWGTRRCLRWMVTCTRDSGYIYLTSSKGAPEPPQKWAGPVRTGRPTWAFSRPVRARSSPRGTSWHFALGPLHLCHFEVVIPVIKTERSLCMNFRSLHLGPREFSIQAH